MRTKLLAGLLTALLFTAGCAPAATDADPFGIFDDDADGRITETEFDANIGAFGADAPDVTFSDIDVDADGFITEEEFGPFEDDFGI